MIVLLRAPFSVMRSVLNQLNNRSSHHSQSICSKLYSSSFHLSVRCPVSVISFTTIIRSSLLSFPLLLHLTLPSTHNTKSHPYDTTNHPPLDSTLSRHHPHSLNSHTPQPLQLSILLIIQSSSWIVPPLPPTNY